MSLAFVVLQRTFAVRAARAIAEKFKSPLARRRVASCRRSLGIMKHGELGILLGIKSMLD